MSLLEDDDREWRSMQRKENRALRRTPELPDDEPETMITTPTPRTEPAPRPSRGGPTSAICKTTPEFRIVDTLPAPENRTGRPIPHRRSELVDFAKANPGRWIEYPPAGDDAYKSIGTFISTVRTGRGGFAPRGTFESTARNKVAYVRYIGTGEGEPS